MKLIIAEKPSVGATIAVALNATERKNGYIQGNGFLVSWCIGHLVGLADAGSYHERYKKWDYEDLPILPEEWNYAVSTDKTDQFNTLKMLMNRSDITEVVNACDAGREGELIFRLVYEMAGCSKPISRLWISSMEDTAIQEGFQNLKPGADYEALYQSALCRSQADWLIGINATRLFSVLYHKTLNIGRVQTPTLAMLVERDAKIDNFQKEAYYHVRLKLDNFEAVSEKYTDLSIAEQAKDACSQKQAICTLVEKEEKSIKPPKLYDLTTLQREANCIFGYTAKQTLDYAQSLYEKKLITYPRTDSNYLTSDMEETVLQVISQMTKLEPFHSSNDFIPHTKPLISDKDVSDHHAIIPTLGAGKSDTASLPVGERNLFLLIASKLLCASAKVHTYETVNATFTCEDYTFTAKGKQIIQAGWKELEKRFRDFLKSKSEEAEHQESSLPELSKGQIFDSLDSFVTEHFTTPPKPYTEDTLLSAMEHAGKEDMPEDAERKGLGTPATRASIIEKLVSTDLAERKGKSLIPTRNGINLITILPETLTSPLLTAEWEQQLSDISKGQMDSVNFINGIEAMATELVKTYSHISEDGQKLFAPEKESLGTCPRCSEQVYEGKKNFYCGNRSCQFVLWKNDRFWISRKKELTKKMVATLLKKGRVSVKGMYSEKKDKTYDAIVILDDTGDKYVNFKLEFRKTKGGR